MQIAVQLKKADIGYGHFPVLKHISIKIPSGDFCLIVGPNGSGKTSLMKTALGIEPLRGGESFIFQKETNYFREWDQVGYLPQLNKSVHPLFPATVEDVVRMGCNGRESHFEEVMELFELQKIRQKMIGECSGGQIQRARLARTFASKRKVVFLDEPNVALEPRIRERFHKELERMHQEEGLTVVYITHDIGEIHHCATHLIYIDRKILFDGNLKDFCMSPDMSLHFGSQTQHLLCHQHDHHDHSDL